MRLLNWLLPKRLKRPLFLLECQIHGSHYYDCLKLVKSQQLRVGQRILLRREPSNEYDKSAIEVLTTSRQKLGYVPKNVNQVIATLMDQGCYLTATIEVIHTTAWEPVTIRIIMAR